jgi:hypothetical protein
MSTPVLWRLTIVLLLALALVTWSASRLLAHMGGA